MQHTKGMVSTPSGSVPASGPVPASGSFTTSGVIGAGTMGIGIAYVLALSGAHVHLVEPDDIQADRARAAIVSRVGRASAREDASARLDGLVDRIHRVTGPAELPAGLDVIIEAVPEQLELKRSVLGLAESRNPGLLGTNTSGISIGALAEGLHEPARLVGLHFFNPVWAMRLLEVVRSAVTTDGVIDRALTLAGQLDKEAITVTDRPGFATSRLGVTLGLEAMRMLQDGVASAADIDKAMELGYRHPMGPLRLTDLVGLDVRLAIARNLQQAYGDRFAPPRILLDKVAAGELGQKSGQGFYPWRAQSELASSL